MEISLPPVNQRIKNLIERETSGNVALFCAKLGYESSQKVNRLFQIDKRTKKYPVPSSEVLTQISNRFEISLDELVNGPSHFEQEVQRPSLKNTNIVEPKGKIITTGRNKRKQEALIPFYNADFMAGNAELYYDDGTIYPEYFMDIPEFSGCTAFRAYSDSMEYKIRSGSILFGVKIEDWQVHLEYGQIYGITCTDGRRYLKYIRKAEDHKNEFLLKSENDNYDDFELPKKKIKNIWLIEGWIDKRT